MISTTEKTNECDELLEGLNMVTVDPFIRNTPVMLRDDGNSFTGSGVILAKDSTRRKMWVATAKHNLWVYSSKKTGYPGHPATWSMGQAQANQQKLRKKFTDEVRVHYQAADLTQTDENGDVPTSFAVTDIDKIVFFDDGFQYDACLLEVSYRQEATPRVAFFELFMREPALRPVVKTMRTLQSSGALPHATQLIQAGFGKQGQKKTSGELREGQLKFKISNFKTDSRVGTYYAEQVEQYTNVFLLDSTAAWTTLPGDSGGPLFAVSPGGCFVLGVALGSDSFLTEEDEPGTLDSDPDGKYNNTATSLLTIYEELLAR